MRIGVICPSEIALRRFMPALQLVDDAEFVGIGIAAKHERFGREDVPSEIIESVLNAEYEKAKVFISQYGGKIFESYESIVRSNEIEAVYIPLPPGLHYKWAKLALECGKHVLVEKPSTISANDTKELVKIASQNKLALHENYMFIFHNQLDEIDRIINDGEIGNVRLYRISFGFPKRSANDFRYSKALGGGALIDAGGYTIKYATRLLGDSAKIKCAQMNYTQEHEVDMYGSATVVNDKGVTAQVAFGMDNSYKCELEVWGSTGCLLTGRVLTAPAGYKPSVSIKKGNEEIIKDLPEDDAFKKSIENFLDCVKSENIRREKYREIVKQAELIEDFRRIANTE